MYTPDMFISGTGVFLPGIVSIEAAIEQGRYSRADASLHELTGAAVAGDLPAPEMALRAAQDALNRCDVLPSEIGLLLYADSWHQGPDGWQPQYHLQHYLLGGKSLAVEIRHGCNGMFSAMELAASYLSAFPERGAALLVAADNFGTPLADRWRTAPEYVMGDAASALILTREPGFAQLLSVASVAVPEAEEMHRSGEPLFPPGPTVGRILDFSARKDAYRRQALTQPDGTSALLEVQRQTLAVVDRVLAEAGIEIGDIDRVAYMNYSREIVEQRCMAALGLPMQCSTWDFGRTVGHLGASDQVVALDHLIRAGELGAGDHLLMLGVGPGVTASCAVVKILQGRMTAGA